MLKSNRWAVTELESLMTHIQCKKWCLPDPQIQWGLEGKWQGDLGLFLKSM